MSDSRFSVVVFLAYCLLCAIVGALAMWLALSGTHTCSVEIQHTDHVAVYITECKI